MEDDFLRRALPGQRTKTDQVQWKGNTAHFLRSAISPSFPFPSCPPPSNFFHFDYACPHFRSRILHSPFWRSRVLELKKIFPQILSWKLGLGGVPGETEIGALCQRYIDLIVLIFFSSRRPFCFPSFAAIHGSTGDDGRPGDMMHWRPLQEGPIVKERKGKEADLYSAYCQYLDH